MGGHNLPPGWDRVNVSENLGKAAVLPALPLITTLKVSKSQKQFFLKLHFPKNDH